MTASMRYGHPSTAAALAFLGGIVYVLSAVAIAVLGTVTLIFGVQRFFPIAGTVAGLLIVGVLTLVFGYLLRREPDLHLVWGALIVVMALVSLPLAFGGFVIGFLLTIIGGILGMVWRIGPTVARLTQSGS